MEDGKEKIFWHLTSRKQKRTIKRENRYEIIEERLPDYPRAERIEWVKKIIQNHQNPRIICFYHQETNPNKDIRLYLWAKQDNFVAYRVI